MVKALLERCNRPWASWMAMVLAIGARIGFLRIYIRIGPDKSALLLLTRNWLQGHGLVIRQASFADLSQSVYRPFPGWPPGYNLLLAPFMRLFPDNYMLAVFLLDVLVTLVFFIYLRKLLLLIGFSHRLAALFLVFHGLFIHPYTVSSNPTDFISMAFLVMGLYHAIRLTMHGNLLRDGGLTLLFWLASGFTRFQNMGIVVGLALIYLLLVARKSDNRRRRWALSILGVLSISILAWLIYSKSASGQMAYLQPAAKGFFPANLMTLYPVIPGAAINMNFYAMQLSLHAGIDYTWWHSGFRWLGWITLLIALYFSVRWYLGWFRSRLTAANVFLLLGGAAAWGTILLLAGLSLTQSAALGPPLFKWTYLQEARYYAFPLLLAQIGLFMLIINQERQAKVWKMVRTGFLMLVFIEIGHGLYYQAKRFRHPMLPLAQAQWKAPEMKRLYDYIIKERAGTNRPIVVTGYFPQFMYLANWYGATGLFEPARLNRELPQSSRPVTLIIALQKRERPVMKSFLLRPEVALVDSAGGNYFYRIDVEPAVD